MLDDSELCEGVEGKTTGDEEEEEEKKDEEEEKEDDESVNRNMKMVQWSDSHLPV